MARNYKISEIDRYLEIKSSIVFEYEYMTVFRSASNNEFIVWNTTKPFADEETKAKGHSHLKSKNKAKEVCMNVVKGRINRKSSTYLLISHIRCSTDQKYIDKLERLIEVRHQKGKQLGYKDTHVFFNI